jgi:hypothetical protein
MVSKLTPIRASVRLLAGRNRMGQKRITPPLAQIRAVQSRHDLDPGERVGH